MQWETPEFTEISLACEISGYENAELSVLNPKEANGVQSSRKF
jgi:coenzyme PQQ precursor peptide PqqA